MSQRPADAIHETLRSSRSVTDCLGSAGQSSNQTGAKFRREIWPQEKQLITLSRSSPRVMDLLVKDCPQSVREGALFREFCRRVINTKDETDRWCVRLRHVDGFIILERIPETRSDRRISFPVMWLMSEKYMQSLIPELEAFLFEICSDD